MASYNYTFQSGDGVTPTRLNDARTVSDIVNADIKSDAAIAGTKIAPAFGGQDITVSTANRSITNTGNFALSFGTNNTERVRIDNAGNVGIGTTSPQGDLEVKDSASNAVVSITSNNSSNSILHLGDTDDVDVGKIQYFHQQNWMSFTTDAAERMRIDASGNVGIGIAPTRKLDVLIDAAPAASQSSKTGLLIRNNNTTGTGGSPNSAAIQFAYDPNTPTGFIECATYGNNFMSFGHGGAERMRIDASGNVGIGTTPSYKLHVNGSVAGVGAYNDVSDAREKQNISYDFQHGLQTVRELKPAHFDYLGDGPQNNLGFIAQDIQQVLPGMVTTFNKTVGEGDEATTEERLAIKEANLIAVLVKAVQELDAKVSALEAAQ